MKRATRLVETGVNFVTLLALSDEGTPSYDHNTAAEFADLGIPAFACTPDLFPELMAATMNRKDLSMWAAQNGIKLPRGKNTEEGEDELL
jgi:hypothetical protein